MVEILMQNFQHFLRKVIEKKNHIQEVILMSIEIFHALNFIEKYNVTVLPDFPILHNICTYEGLVIKFYPFSGRIKAIYHTTADQIELIAIKKGLPEPHLKHLLACVLAHRLLSQPSTTSSYVKVLGFSEYYFDVKAENFAALFLVPPPALAGICEQVSACEISRLARIPKSLAKRRVDIYRHQSL